jgi:hypothetical protein
MLYVRKPMFESDLCRWTRTKSLLWAFWCRVAHVKHHTYTYHVSPTPFCSPSIWAGTCKKCGHTWVDED